MGNGNGAHSGNDAVARLEKRVDDLEREIRLISNRIVSFMAFTKGAIAVALAVGLVSVGYQVLFGKGERGEKGNAGPGIHIAEQNPPDDTRGIPGSVYVSTTTWDVWGPKKETTWQGTHCGTLRGTDGVDGTDGRDGTVFVLSSTVPDSTEVPPGSVHLDTSTLELRGPSAIGGWPEPAATLVTTLTDVPIGSLIPFAGRLNDEFEFDLQQAGWLICDGRPIPSDSRFDELRAVLQGTGWTENPNRTTPDLQGMFVRGVDNRANSQSRDSDPRFYGDSAQSRVGTNDRIGSWQPWATGIPGDWRISEPTNVTQYGDNVRFIHAQAGGPGGFSAAAGGGTDHVRPFPNLQYHRHRLQGRDTETRPINVGVYWIIKGASRPRG